MNTSYDEVPYTSHVFKFTHPGALATLATLFGLQPPPLAGSRVLELGCASGTNLMAMAQATPDGEFVGIDLANRQIQEGQDKLRCLGMKNVTLKQMSIMDITHQLGKFDYIVVHGVYSWVPAEVQDKILQVCHDNLTSNGIAYVSYNTYPGWYVQNTLRELMLYHTQQFPQIPLKMEQAKAALQLFEQLLKTQTGPYSFLLKQHIERLLKERDDYLFHEYLERNNVPMFFSQFMDRATRYGLHYLADSDVGSMFATHLAPEIADILRPVDDPIRQEQLLDFVTNRSFRRTLLCRQPVATQIVPQAVTGFHLAAPLVALSPTPNLTEGIEEEFQHSLSDQKWSTTSAVVKALSLCLGRAWPQSLSFGELLQQVHSRLDVTPGKVDSPQLQDPLINSLIALYLKENVELFRYPPQLTRTVSACPLTTPLTRLQAHRGETVTNVYGGNDSFGPGITFLLGCLDGHQDRAALINLVLQQVETGQLEIVWSGNRFSFRIPQKSSGPIPSPPPGMVGEELRNLMSGFVDRTLQLLASKAFLVA